MKTTLARVVAVAALAGCASLDRVDADVTAFSRWPAGRPPASYVFERLPSQQAEPQQAQLLEDAARLAVEGAGFVPAAEGAVADVTVQLGARIAETDRSPFDDPFWSGRYGVWHRPFGYARFGRPYGAFAWRGGFWGPYGDFPTYEREVAVLIRDKRSGEPLYEARADTEGTSSGVRSVLPAMFVAALKDFPSGSATNPHRVTVEANR